VLIRTGLDQLAQLASRYSWAANDLDALLHQLSARWKALSACWQGDSRIEAENLWNAVRRSFPDRVDEADRLANWLRRRVVLFEEADTRCNFGLPDSPIFVRPVMVTVPVSVNLISEE
jgi:WXG100 family type VII secretion target